MCNPFQHIVYCLLRYIMSHFILWCIAKRDWKKKHFDKYDEIKQNSFNRYSSTNRNDRILIHDIILKAIMSYLTNYSWWIFDSKNFFLDF